MKNYNGYKVICHESFEACGWEGDEEYRFETLEEAQRFINDCLPSLGEASDKNRLYNTDGTPTDQHYVTYSMICTRGNVSFLDIKNDRYKRIWYVRKFREIMAQIDQAFEDHCVATSQENSDIHLDIDTMTERCQADEQSRKQLISTMTEAIEVLAKEIAILTK